MKHKILMQGMVHLIQGQGTGFFNSEKIKNVMKYGFKMFRKTIRCIIDALDIYEFMKISKNDT